MEPLLIRIVLGGYMHATLIFFFLAIPWKQKDETKIKKGVEELQV
jgi:hypothetical protein